MLKSLIESGCFYLKKILVFFMTIFLFNINVSAASLCTYQEQTELNSKAANIKVSYEIVEDILHFADGDAEIKVFNIQIFNVTDEFYILVKNDVNKEEKIYDIDDAVDGVISFKWDYAESVTNFTIQVYTTNKTNCAEEKYKTIYLTTPRYNRFFNIESCQELSDFYLCQEYVTFSEISKDKFITQLESYRNGELNNKGEEPVEEPKTGVFEKVFNFINDYKLVIIGGVVVVVSITFTAHHIKRKKQRELGL